MTIITIEYQYKVLQRLLKAKENMKIACSKSGLSLKEAKEFLIKN